MSKDTEPVVPLERLPVATNNVATTPEASRSEAIAATLKAFPGLREYEGRTSDGVADLRGVMELLSSAHIPACIVGVNALRYYGAGRVTWEWDICVADEQIDDAVAIFQGNDDYRPAKPPPPVVQSRRHEHPIFKLKEAMFFFILTPSSACFIDPRPEHCELSNKGIPYPQMPQFASSLLVLQNGADTADFIDGMNLDETWAENNLDFSALQEKGREFSLKQNETMGSDEFNVDMDYWSEWSEVVRSKDRRIEPMKQGRYKSRWRRIKNDMDPRQRDRDM